MSRFVLLLLTIGLTVSGIGVAGAAGSGTDREKELLGEIEKLRTRVAVLEARLKAVEARPKQPIEPPSPPLTLQWAPSTPRGTVPLFAPSSDRLPDGTVEREFNGMTYYIMPIASTDADESRLSRTAPVLASPAR